MKKLLSFIIVLSLFSIKSFSQKDSLANKTDTAGAAKLQMEANKFIDSLFTHTTLKQFQEFLYESVSQKTANEGKFGELYNLFLQQQYAAWIQRKAQPKKSNK